MKAEFLLESMDEVNELFGKDLKIAELERQIEAQRMLIESYIADRDSLFRLMHKEIDDWGNNCWEITGIRVDKICEAMNIPIETFKPADED